MNDMAEIVEVEELLPGTEFAKRIRCKLCREVVFLLGDGCTQSDIQAEMVRMNAHMGIQHQITIEYHKYDDHECKD